MGIENVFPIWNKLTENEKQMLKDSAVKRRVEKGKILHKSSGECLGLGIVEEKDTEFWLIPPNVYRELMEKSTAVANYTNELMASRFSEVMWLIEQVMFKSFDKRLAAFLLEESNIENSDRLEITHERIANHLGSAREVVTRMLKYFQNEGAVKLSRGAVEITDRKKLSEIADD